MRIDDTTEQARRRAGACEEVPRCVGLLARARRQLRGASRIRRSESSVARFPGSRIWRWNMKTRTPLQSFEERMREAVYQESAEVKGLERLLGYGLSSMGGPGVPVARGAAHRFRARARHSGLCFGAGSVSAIATETHEHALTKLKSDYPDRLVSFTAWGGGVCPDRSGSGHSSRRYMKFGSQRGTSSPPCSAVNVCDSKGLDVGHYAHEVGHFLGLPHTHKNARATVAELNNAYLAAGCPVDFFDDDAAFFVSDTPRDPLAGENECKTSTTSVLIQECDGTSRVYDLPRTNIMSYYLSKVWPKDKAIRARPRESEASSRPTRGAFGRTEGPTILEEPAPQSAAHRLGLRVHVKLRIDRPNVVPDGVHAHVEVKASRLVAVTFRE